ncbi:hypothetical protein EV188_103635 [Actinomycetospora succinea]|uniref:EcsC family protein n=1 Tax=Actinomycetospora succinea TaxID=663603 RepID=A0A4V3DAA5_9PSEU|nr:hypothetical protein [Actinomycetospora succinea]TDQ61128.1 hypothetical protein EV188_103635 [Actinomycetospora succinea]
MTAALAPLSLVPPPVDPPTSRVSDVLATLTGWLRALPGPGDLASFAGTAGEWLGHATLDPARVVLGRETPEPAVGDDVLDARPAFTRLYATVGAVQAGASGLLTGVLGAGRWAPVVGVLGALGVDTLLTTATCVRAVSHVGASYGFAVRSDDDRTQVLALVATTLGGTAHGACGTQRSGAAAAEADDRRQLAGLVVMRLSVHRGPTELLRFVPAAGPVLDAALGAFLGARLLARVVDDAERHYRARYLRERSASACRDAENVAILA